jgi:hypothetical protein
VLLVPCWCPAGAAGALLVLLVLLAVLLDFFSKNFLAARFFFEKLFSCSIFFRKTF